MEFEQNGRTYGKTMEFLCWWKKVRVFFKKMGGKYVRTSKCSLIFVASVITSLGLALRTSRAIIPLAYCSAE